MTGTHATQEEVYNASIGDTLRRNIFRGFNTTVMTFGQKNTGKSYTMYGPKMKQYKSLIDDDNGSVKTVDSYNTTHGSYDEDGIVPRAIYDLFMAKDKQATGGEVVIQMTFIEIYNDGIVDLLTHTKSKVAKQLLIRDNAADGNAGGVTIRGLTAIKLKSTSHARHILNAASRRRKSASRSHTICTLHVKINPAVNSTITSGKLASMTSIDIISAKLTLVDLAGSERAKGGTSSESNAIQKENACVSKDLFVLSQCILGLSENRGKSDTPSKTKHIPFRDCKLTRILRDSLGGNCYTIMVACVAPCTKDLEGTLSTLRSAERSRNITSHVKKNLIKMNALTPAEGAALRKENKVLKSHVLDITRKMQNFRRGPKRNKIVVDLGDLQEGSVQESMEAKRWRLKFEKLLKACRETNISSDEVVKLTNDDEDMLISHSLEVQELKEQINWLTSCQFGDGASVTSGLTMDTYDLDDYSITSATKCSEPFSSIGSRSLTPKEEAETKEIIETENRKLNEKIKASNAEQSEKETEDRELDKKIKASKEKLSELEREVKVWIEQEEELKDNFSSRQTNLQTINGEIEESESRLAALNKEKKALTGKVEDAQELIEFSNETIEEKVAECDRINSQLISLKEQVKELRSQKDSLGVEVEDFQHKKDEFDRINSQLISLKEQVKALCTERDFLVKETEEFQNISEVLYELNIEKKAMEEVQMLLESVSKEVDCLRSNLCDEKETRLATEEQVASLELRLMVEGMKEQESVNELDRSTISLKSNLDDLDCKLRAQSKTTEMEKVNRLAAEQKVASLEMRMKELLEERKKKESANELGQSATKEVESLRSSLDELDRKLQVQSEATEMEKSNRLAAEQKAVSLERRVKELLEGKKDKESANGQDQQQQNLESRVSELESLIKMQLTQKTEQQNSKKLVLRDQSNELTKPPLAHPPLAKKRRNTPTRALVAHSPSFVNRDDRSVMSTISMSGLLQECNYSKEEGCSRSVSFGGSDDTDHIDRFNSSFDSQSFMSGASFSIGSVSMTSDQKAIRVHAHKLLLWAGKAVKGHPDDYSLASDKENMGNTLSTGGFQIIKTPDRSRSRRSGVDSSRSISRERSNASPGYSKCSASTQHEKGCSCKKSIFSGVENSEFFLPKLGLACTCGAEDRKAKQNEDPTALKSFLRSWQVSYLKSIGVSSAHDLITQYEKRGQEISRAMKHWRNAKRMKPARTKSCLIALEIWTKTAKTRVKLQRSAIQRSGKPLNSSLLEIAAAESNDSDSVSVMSAMSMDEFDNDALYEGEYEI